MEDMLLVYSSYSFDLIKIFLIFWGIIGYRFRKIKLSYRIIIPIGMVSLLTISGYLVQNKLQATSIALLFVFYTIVVIFDGKLQTKLISFIIAYLSIALADLCVLGFLSLLLKKNYNVIMDDSLYGSIYLTFNIITIIMIIVTKRITHLSFENNKLSKRYFLFIITGLFCGTFILSGLIISNLPGAGENLKRMVLAIVIIICIIYLVICGMLVIVMNSRDSYKQLSQINQTVIEAQQKYYLLVHEKQEEIRGIRHEIKNHLACMNSLYKNGKMQELGDYLKAFIADIDGVETLLDSGNDIVNAIINDANSRYRSEGIHIILEGMLPKPLSIESMDLCVIFANAISNAVEAIQLLKQEKKNNIEQIRIKITSFKKDLFITITNPVGKKIDTSVIKIKTSKSDDQLHGFGTENIKRKVQKYDGEVTFECSELEFAVKIHMINVSEIAFTS
ncbi:MAG: ATP-binding region ATPase protein [Herbinix sp.]|jgi:hypothetical protein|nr:ATP-binding region ATPase protein [Herbinix sp.]